MKIKTSELTGATLDWAVATAQGARWQEPSVRAGFWIWPGPPLRYSMKAPPYSSDWAQGGPIIEREKIAILPDDGHRFSQWRAFCWHPSQHDLTFEDATSHMEAGPTPLIAAMRCFVASKLGDEVDVPKELL